VRDPSKTIERKKKKKKGNLLTPRLNFRKRGKKNKKKKTN